MNDGSAQAYLRSEATLRQPSQTNIRSAGCVPELRWSAKCFICAPQPLQTRVGTSCVSGARSSIANPSQKKPKPMNDRKTDSPLCNLSIFEENRHLREFPWPVRSVTRPGESLVQRSKITALRSWRCPRFCHGAVDDVALDSLASWARKRSQVLAGRLGSIAASLMGEPQAVHCGPWFWASSMGCFSGISAHRPPRVRRRANQPLWI